MACLITQGDHNKRQDENIHGLPYYIQAGHKLIGPWISMFKWYTGTAYIFRLEDSRLQCTDPNKMYEFKRDILLWPHMENKGRPLYFLPCGFFYLSSFFFIAALRSRCRHYIFPCGFSFVYTQGDSDVISLYHIYVSCFSVMLQVKLCEVFLIRTSLSQ